MPGLHNLCQGGSGLIFADYLIPVKLFLVSFYHTLHMIFIFIVLFYKYKNSHYRKIRKKIKLSEVFLPCNILVFIFPHVPQYTCVDQKVDKWNLLTSLIDLIIFNGSLYFNDIHLYYHFHGCGMSLCGLSWVPVYFSTQAFIAHPTYGQRSLSCNLRWCFSKRIQSNGSGHTNETLVWWVSWPYTKEVYVMNLRTLKKGLGWRKILTGTNQGSKLLAHSPSA